MRFKHIVRKSTFKQGFTIPKSIYSYISLPEKGNNRQIRLLFNNDQVMDAKLYRINNSVGHLQVRYEGKYGEKFRSWLVKTFTNSYNYSETNCNEYFEVVIVNDRLLEIKAFPIAPDAPDKTIVFEDMITHKISANALIDDERFIEIVESIRVIKFQERERQMYYNFEIKKELLKRNWLSEQKVVNDERIRLKCDFRKSDFQLEVEFGNARTYYQDIIKFVMSYNTGIIKVGGLLVPSVSFSKHLCYLGRLNALEKSKGLKSRYSGMMNFNKAIVEFEYIKDIFNIPFFIIAINHDIKNISSRYNPPEDTEFT